MKTCRSDRAIGFDAQSAPALPEAVQRTPPAAGSIRLRVGGRVSPTEMCDDHSSHGPVCTPVSPPTRSSPIQIRKFSSPLAGSRLSTTPADVATQTPSDGSCS